MKVPFVVRGWDVRDQWALKRLKPMRKIAKDLRVSAASVHAAVHGGAGGD